jgi:hypothetical protein
MSGLAGFSSVDGNVLEGVSAATLWMLRNRATEAKRSDGVIRVDGGLALAGRIPCLRKASDVALPRGRGIFKWAFWPPMDRRPLIRHRRPSGTLLEFG